MPTTTSDTNNNIVPVFRHDRAIVFHVTTSALQQATNIGNVAYLAALEEARRPKLLRSLSDVAPGSGNSNDMLAAGHHYMCLDYYTRGVCALHTACTFIHVKRRDVVSSNNVHINDLRFDGLKVPLPEGKCVLVHDATAEANWSPASSASSNNSSAAYPAERVLWTKGTRDLTTAERRRYHCHHFLTKGWCLRGETCSFVHVLGTRVVASPVSSTGSALSTVQSPLLPRVPILCPPPICGGLHDDDDDDDKQKN